jgi:Transposase DDE domain
VHLLVDSTGLKLGGPDEWLTEKHGTRKRRAWRKLHLGVDANTGYRADAARSTPAADRRARPPGLAEGVRLSSARLGGDGGQRYKRVIGDALRSRTESGQATEVAIAVHEPHARARTPEVRPDRLSDDGAQAWCVNSQLRATRQVGEKRR